MSLVVYFFLCYSFYLLLLSRCLLCSGSFFLFIFSDFLFVIIFFDHVHVLSCGCCARSNAVVIYNACFFANACCRFTFLSFQPQRFSFLSLSLYQPLYMHFLLYSSLCFYCLLFACSLLYITICTFYVFVARVMLLLSLSSSMCVPSYSYYDWISICIFCFGFIMCVLLYLRFLLLCLYFGVFVLSSILLTISAWYSEHLYRVYIYPGEGYGRACVLLGLYLSYSKCPFVLFLYHPCLFLFRFRIVMLSSCRLLVAFLFLCFCCWFSYLLLLFCLRLSWVTGMPKIKKSTKKRSKSEAWNDGKMNDWSSFTNQEQGRTKHCLEVSIQKPQMGKLNIDKMNK